MLAIAGVVERTIHKTYLRNFSWIYLQNLFFYSSESTSTTNLNNDYSFLIKDFFKEYENKTGMDRVHPLRGRELRAGRGESRGSLSYPLFYGHVW